MRIAASALMLLVWSKALPVAGPEGMGGGVGGSVGGGEEAPLWPQPKECWGWGLSLNGSLAATC